MGCTSSSQDIPLSTLPLEVENVSAENKISNSSPSPSFRPKDTTAPHEASNPATLDSVTVVFKHTSASSDRDVAAVAEPQTLRRTVSSNPGTLSKGNSRNSLKRPSSMREFPSTPLTDDDARERKYQLIKSELISTETTYVSNMETARDVFINPMRDKIILDSTTISNQFREYLIICNLHRTLLDDLSKPGACIGRVFLDYIPAMAMYKGYLQNYEARMKDRATLLASNVGFKIFLAEESRDPRCRDSTLESYLVEPVQRIPRYKLLIEELRKKMKPDNEDWDDLNKAYSMVSDLAASNIEAIRQMESHVEMMARMMKIIGITGINVLDEPHRHILKEDILKCPKLRGDGFQQFEFWLFNDKIVHGAVLGMDSTRRLSIGSKVNYTEVPLAKCRVQREHRHSVANSESSFLFQSPKNSFVAVAKSEQERDKWVVAINSAIEALRTADDDNRVMAPVWQTDSASITCELCPRHFDLTNRRHHCRACGLLVCDSCSPKRVTLTYMDCNSPVRVCDLCYHSIGSTGNAAADAGVVVRAPRENVTVELVLQLTLLSARGLPNVDLMSLTDPYVVMTMGTSYRKSRVIDDNLSPEWGDNFVLPWSGSNNSHVLRLEVFDSDIVFDESVGYVDIPLSTLGELQVDGDLRVFDLPLGPSGKPRGSIQFVLSLQKWTTHYLPPSVSVSPRNSAGT